MTVATMEAMLHKVRLLCRVVRVRLTMLAMCVRHMARKNKGGGW